MQIPDRLARVVRPSEHPGLLLATAYGTATLSVGPFLLPAIADRYEVGLGLASLATASQLAGFVVGSWGAGRFLRPRGRVLAVMLAVAVMANALSALVPPLGLLVGLRLVNGVALGAITWYAWAQVFGDKQRMGSIAVVGPIVGVTTTPIAAQLLDRFGVAGLFVALAVTAVVPLGFARRSGVEDPAYFAPPKSESARHRASPAAKQVLAALTLLTMGGSAVFTFGAVIALDTTALSIGAVSLAYSANAIAAIPSARWKGRRGIAGLWISGCGLCAILLGWSPTAAVFIIAIVLWGFLFWMGVPGAYTVLSRCSNYPEERAGDAQAVMAAGRVIGPLAGGVILDLAGHTVLGLCGGALMIGGGLVLVRVDRRHP